MEYALDYCYVQNTYFVPMTDVKVHNAFDFGSHMVELPRNYSERDEKQIGKYKRGGFVCIEEKNDQMNDFRLLSVGTVYTSSAGNTLLSSSGHMALDLRKLW